MLILYHPQEDFVHLKNMENVKRDQARLLVDEHKRYLNTVCELLFSPRIARIIVLCDRHPPSIEANAHCHRLTTGAAVYPLLNSALVDWQKSRDRAVPFFHELIPSDIVDELRGADVFVAGMFHNNCSAKQLGSLLRDIPHMYFISPCHDQTQFVEYKSKIVKFSHFGVDDDGIWDEEGFVEWQKSVNNEAHGDEERAFSHEGALCLEGGKVLSKASVLVYRQVREQLEGRAEHDLTYQRPDEHEMDYRVSHHHGKMYMPSPLSIPLGGLSFPDGGLGHFARWGANQYATCLLLDKKKQLLQCPPPLGRVERGENAADTCRRLFAGKVKEGGWKKVELVYRGFMPHEDNTAHSWMEITCFSLLCPEEENTVQNEYDVKTRYLMSFVVK